MSGVYEIHRSDDDTFSVTQRLPVEPYLVDHGTYDSLQEAARAAGIEYCDRPWRRRPRMHRTPRKLASAESIGRWVSV